MTICRANMTHLKALAGLFNDYRQFYEYPSDPTATVQFLQDRLDRQDSVILIAHNVEGLIGFTQLYPSFSSTRMAPIFILNDLFVAPHARRQGTATALLTAAQNHARAQKAVRLTLSTAHDNITAQALYARQGWVPDTQFKTYDFALPPVEG